MRAVYDGVNLRLDSLAEAQGISEYIKNTAKLVSSPQLGIDQMDAFQVGVVQELCGGLVKNNIELSVERHYLIEFPKNRVASFNKYVSATLEHAKTVGCTDHQIAMIGEAVKWIS